MLLSVHNHIDFKKEIKLCLPFLFITTNIKKKVTLVFLLNMYKIISFKDVINQPRTTNFPEFASLMKTGPPSKTTL